MSQQEPPKIEFPCPNYMVKVLGVSGEPTRQFVIKTFNQLNIDIDPTAMKITPSGKGTFESLTLFITAESPQQLSDLNEALRKSDLVKIVL